MASNVSAKYLKHGRYLIYALTDPRFEDLKDSGIYIGYSTRGTQRPLEHGSACDPWNDDKHAAIEALAKLGLQPEITILETLDDAIALLPEDWERRRCPWDPRRMCNLAAAEVHWIKRIGRADLGEGTLTNLTDGGGGIRNPHQSTRAKLSAASKKRFEDPVYAANAIANLGAPWDDREYAAMMSANSSAQLTAQWKDPAFAAMKAAWSTEQWDDPEYRSTMLASITAQWADPAFVALHSAKLTAQKSDPAFEARRASALAAKRETDPDYAERMVKQLAEASTRNWSDPVHVVKMSDVTSRESTKRWNTPGYKEAFTRTRTATYKKKLGCTHEECPDCDCPTEKPKVRKRPPRPSMVEHWQDPGYAGNQKRKRAIRDKRRVGCTHEECPDCDCPTTMRAKKKLEAAARKKRVTDQQ